MTIKANFKVKENRSFNNNTRINLSIGHNNPVFIYVIIKVYLGFK